MNKPVRSALPGALTLLGWAVILAGVFLAVTELLDNPGGALKWPLAYFLGGLWFGSQQLALAGILNRLPERP